MTTASVPAVPPAVARAADVDTVADLLHRLGVLASRVWNVPARGTADEDDLLYAIDRLGRRCELVDGTLVEKPAGNHESAVAAWILILLGNVVVPRKLGLLLGEASLFRCLPRQVRGPDVAFVAKWQMPNGLPTGPIWKLGPALVVEVLRPSNTKREMRHKRQLYFGAGVQLVWMVDPPSRTVRVYTAPEQFAELTAADRLTGGPVLDGFDVAVADVFSPLDA